MEHQLPSRPEHNTLVKNPSVPRNSVANKIHRFTAGIQNAPRLQRPPWQPIKLLQQNPRLRFHILGQLHCIFVPGYFAVGSVPHTAAGSAAPAQSNPQTQGCHSGHTQGTKGLGTSKTIQQLGNSCLIKKERRKNQIRVKKMVLRKWIVFTRRSQCSHFGKSWRQILTSHNQDNESWAENPPWTYMLSWNQSICNLGVSVWM